VERLLGQEKSEVVGKFLAYVSSDNLFISDFALHSIGVILSRLKRRDAFLKFIDDLFINGSVSIVYLEAEDMRQVISVIEQFNIDFDDAYQYIAAQKSNLTIVSFDKDFDNTQAGRISPEDILSGRR
jgi:predicted nucleic acid-binding protein